MNSGTVWVGRDFKDHPFPPSAMGTFHYARLLQDGLGSLSRNEVQEAPSPERITGTPFLHFPLESSLEHMQEQLSCR